MVKIKLDKARAINELDRLRADIAWQYLVQELEKNLKIVEEQVFSPEIDEARAKELKIWRHCVRQLIALPTSLIKDYTTEGVKDLQFDPYD